MVAEARTWVDVEAAVRAWARDTVELAGRRVFFATNTRVKDAQIVVQRIAGPDDNCLIQFDVWADSKADAAALAAALSTELDDLASFVHEGVALRGATVESSRWLPDAESNAPRYVVEAVIFALASEAANTEPPVDPPPSAAPAQGDVMYAHEQSFTFDDFDLLGSFDALATFDELLPAGAVVVGAEFEVSVGFVDAGAAPGPGLIITTTPTSIGGWAAKGPDPDLGTDPSVPGNFGASLSGNLQTTFKDATQLYVRAISATSATPFVAGAVKVTVYYFLAIISVLEVAIGFADLVESVDNPLGYVAVFPDALPDGVRVTHIEWDVTQEFDADPLLTPDYPTSSVFADYLDPVNGVGSGASYTGPALDAVQTVRTLASQSGDYPWVRPTAPVLALGYAGGRPVLTKGAVTIRLFYRGE